MANSGVYRPNAILVLRKVGPGFEITKSGPSENFEVERVFVANPRIRRILKVEKCRIRLLCRNQCGVMAGEVVSERP